MPEGVGPLQPLRLCALHQVLNEEQPQRNVFGQAHFVDDHLNAAASKKTTRRREGKRATPSEGAKELRRVRQVCGGGGHSEPEAPKISAGSGSGERSTRPISARQPMHRGLTHACRVSPRSPWRVSDEHAEASPRSALQGPGLLLSDPGGAPKVRCGPAVVLRLRPPSHGVHRIFVRYVRSRTSICNRPVPSPPSLSPG